MKGDDRKALGGATHQLVRWLGPWASEPAPGAERFERVLASAPPLTIIEYSPSRGRLRGAYVVVPGLHFRGPHDVRFDRLCRALAAAGFRVTAPVLPSHLRLEVSRDSVDHLARAFDDAEARALEHDAGAPALFSISFGSAPALSLAARDDYRRRVSGVVVFGGFCEFRPTVRFLTSGRYTWQGRDVVLPHDPLNTPVALLNLLAFVPDVSDRAALAEALRDAARATWGQPAMRAMPARARVLEPIAQRLLYPDRERFRRACGLQPGGLDDIERALEAAGDAFSYLDAGPSLAALRAPVAFVHGRGDDVIPWFEAEKSRALLASRHEHRSYYTGLYAHTDASRPRVTAIAREASTLLGIARAIALAPTGRLPLIECAARAGHIPRLDICQDGVISATTRAVSDVHQRFTELFSRRIPVVLAPMEDVSDAVFRRICRARGADLCVTEFVNVEGLLRGCKTARRKISIEKTDAPTAIQIYGSDPERLAEAAVVAEAAEPAYIDINCGCWVPKIAGRGAGAGWLRDPDAMVAMASRIVKSVAMPVTVKTRVGYGPESHMPIVDLARRLEDAGVAALTIHCRTASMGHSGSADWSWARKAREVVSMPVLVNGDVKTADDAARALEETGCAGVMIGRSAIDHPWVFGEARALLDEGRHVEPPSAADRFALCREHLRANTEERGEPHGVRVTRRHLMGYLRGLRGAAALRRELLMCDSLEGCLSILDNAEARLSRGEGCAAQNDELAMPQAAAGLAHACNAARDLFRHRNDS